MRQRDHVLSFGTFYGTKNTQRRVGEFDVALMDADPYRVVERHTHEHAHFVLVLDGLYSSSADGAAAICKGPTLIFNPPGTTHRDRFESSGRRTFQGTFLTVSLGAHLEVSRSLPARAVAVSNSDAIGFAQKLAHTVAEAAQRDSIVETIGYSLVASLNTCVFTPRGRPPRWLHDARTAMHDNDGQSSVAAIAAEVGVHPVHLARVFRAHFGCSPVDYMQTVRTDRALALIRETRRPLADVALSCGFVDQSHLTRAFRRRFGVTPGAFRE